MIWIYVAATIFGGAFIIPMILGGLDSDIGGDLDADVGGGLDVDADIDIDMDVGDLGDGPGTDIAGNLPEMQAGGGAGFETGLESNPFGAVFASLLSFRTVVFFSTFFGVAGLVFGALDYSDPITLATAVLIGGISAVINSTLFGLIKNSQPNSQISDQTLEGRRARVVLPMTLDQRGRIRIDLSGQSQYMVARPLDDGSDQQFDVGASVVVVKIENGTALVSSLAELEAGEEY